MVEIPNIYKGDYRLLSIVPIALVILSLFFIPNIKMGVEFTGGTLITINLYEPANTEQLRIALASEGLEGNVRTYDSAVGPKAEIELGQSAELEQAEQIKQEFIAKYSNVVYLEVESNQNGSIVEEYLKERTELNQIADRMFAVSGTGKIASEISNLNTLEREFNSAYLKTYSNFREQISKAIDKHLKYSSLSVQTVSPVLSIHFFEQAKWVVIFSAVLSIVFVFLFFRKLVPSIAVIIGATCDLLIALGAMGLFQIPLTLPSFAALIMITGFSLDTDILLTARMLKRKGEPREKAMDALKTGTTMSLTAIVAFSTLFIISMLTRIPTYYEISAVALAGLIGDLFATWGINAVLLLWYVEKKGGDA